MINFTNRLIHVTDWFPTLYSAAGGNVKDLGHLDGIDQWDTLKVQGPSRRTEMLYNSNPLGTQSPTGSAIRYLIIVIVTSNILTVLPQVRRHEADNGRARPGSYCGARKIPK